MTRGAGFPARLTGRKARPTVESLHPSSACRCRSRRPSPLGPDVAPVTRRVGDQSRQRSGRISAARRPKILPNDLPADGLYWMLQVSATSRTPICLSFSSSSGRDAAESGIIHSGVSCCAERPQRALPMNERMAHSLILSSADGTARRASSAVCAGNCPFCLHRPRTYWIFPLTPASRLGEWLTVFGRAQASQIQGLFPGGHDEREEIRHRRSVMPRFPERAATSGMADKAATTFRCASLLGLIAAVVFMIAAVTDWSGRSVWADDEQPRPGKLAAPLTAPGCPQAFCWRDDRSGRLTRTGPSGRPGARPPACDKLAEQVRRDRPHTSRRGARRASQRTGQDARASHTQPHDRGSGDVQRDPKRARRRPGAPRERRRERGPAQRPLPVERQRLVS
jgi:hypothetical protein